MSDINTVLNYLTSMGIDLKSFTPEKIEKFKEKIKDLDLSNDAEISEDQLLDILNVVGYKKSGVAKKLSNETKIKIGRNDPCLCGSGTKYKKCCGMCG